MTDQDGQEQVGRYRMVRPLGRGAMGIVYLADDSLLHRPVAMKTVDLSEADPEQREFFHTQLLRDARAAAGLSHPNIVSVYDIVEEADRTYLVMEYVEGDTLAVRLRQGSLPSPLLVRVLRELAAALDYTHSRGIIHRDVKPGNVMVTPQGLVKIMDFGIARIADARTTTPTGVVMGTIEYMSPEQVKGEPVDGRADQFSLAAVAYQMLTGSTVYGQQSITTLVYKIVHEPPPPVRVRRPELPMAVDEVLGRALAKTPASRYPTCLAFVEALEVALAGGSTAVIPEQSSESPMDEKTTVLRPAAAPEPAAEPEPPPTAPTPRPAPSSSAVKTMSLSDALKIGNKRKRRPKVGIIFLVIGLVGAWNLIEHKPKRVRQPTTVTATEPSDPDADVPSTAPKPPVSPPAPVAPGAAAPSAEVKPSPKKSAPAEDESPTANDSSPLLDEGLQQLETKDYQKAIETFTEALDRSPQLTRARFARGLAYQGLDRASLAIEDFTKVIEQNPRHGLAHYHRALTYFRQQEFDPALHDLQEAERIQPRFVNAYVLEGQVRSRLRQPSEAIRAFSDAIQIAPRLGKAYLERGKLKMQVGDHAGGLSDIQKGTALMIENGRSGELQVP